MSDIVDRARRNATVIYIAVAESVADEISGVLVDCADEIDRLRAALARLQQERDEARALVGEWQTAVMAYLPLGWCFDPTAPGLMVSNVARAATQPPTPPTETQEPTR